MKKSKMIDKNSLRKWVEKKNTQIGMPTKTKPNALEELRGNTRNQYCN